MKYISIFAFACLMVGAGVLLSDSVGAENASDPSVELGLLETSPKGAEAGLAMPASGASLQLSYRQTGESNWKTASPGVLPDDDAVDLRWQTSAGSKGYVYGSTGKIIRTNSGSDMDNCRFTSGYLAPTGDLAGDGTSIGQSFGRNLSDTGNRSTYSISCTDDHDEAGHSGNPYSLSDTVLLSLVTECSDDIDNDGDGLIDENDPGCLDASGTYDPTDDDERDDSPSMTLEACNQDGDCAPAGDTLTIDELDSVRVYWTSVNTDFCDPVGTFAMTGNPTSGNDGIDEPKKGETVNLVVTCGNNGTPQVVRSVAVRFPTIQLIPYPKPPIVPATGMPSGDPATVEPLIAGYLPAACTLSGPEGTNTIASLQASGQLAGGTYEVTLHSQGETTYILECRADTNGDGVGDGSPVRETATFRILPVIEET